MTNIQQNNSTAIFWGKRFKIYHLLKFIRDKGTFLITRNEELGIKVPKDFYYKIDLFLDINSFRFPSWAREIKVISAPLLFSFSARVKQRMTWPVPIFREASALKTIFINFLGICGFEKSQDVGYARVRLEKDGHNSKR